MMRMMRRVTLDCANPGLQATLSPLMCPVATRASTKASILVQSFTHPIMGSASLCKFQTDLEKLKRNMMTNRKRENGVVQSEVMMVWFQRAGSVHVSKATQPLGTVRFPGGGRARKKSWSTEPLWRITGQRK